MAKAKKARTKKPAAKKPIARELKFLDCWCGGQGKNDKSEEWLTIVFERPDGETEEISFRNDLALEDLESAMLIAGYDFPQASPNEED